MTSGEISLYGLNMDSFHSFGRYKILTDYELLNHENPRLMRHIREALEPFVKRSLSNYQGKTDVLTNFMDLYNNVYRYVSTGDTINRLQAVESMPSL